MIYQIRRNMALLSSDRQQTWVGVGLILAVFMLLLVFINPLRNVAIADDWDYARSARQLLYTGIFRRSEIMTASAFFPAIWGALFAKLFGFSFVTLRLSTLVLALGALIFFYALLGELDFQGARRVLAVLTLLVSPVFVFLAFSFMTDMSFLFAIVGALYFFVRAHHRQDLRWMFIGSLFSGLAFLTRQLGILIPFIVGMMILLDWPASIFPAKPGGRVRLRWFLAAVGVPGVVFCLYFAWAKFLGGATWADGARTFGRTWDFWRQPDIAGFLLRRFVEAIVTLGVYILPLWFGLAPALPEGWRQWRQSGWWRKIALGFLAALFAAVVIRLAGRDEWFPYLPDQLTRHGMRPYLAYIAYTLNIQRPLVVPLSLSVLLTGLGVVAGLILCDGMLRRMTGRAAPEFALVYGTTLALAAATMTFFSFYEHYLLALMPGVIILVLDMTRRVHFSPGSATVGFLLVAVCSMALMRDYFSFTELKWNTAEALHRAGVPIEQIDAGFEWDGWHLYDESVAYIQANHLPMEVTPWEYIWDPQYIFTFAPVPGYRVEQPLTFSTPLRPGGTDLLLLLRREDSKSLK